VIAILLCSAVDFCVSCSSQQPQPPKPDSGPAWRRQVDNTPTLTFYEHENFEGRNLTVTIPRGVCINLASEKLCDGATCISARNRISSMWNYGNCALLFRGDDCLAGDDPAYVVDRERGCFGWWWRDEEYCNYINDNINSVRICNTMTEDSFCPNKNEFDQRLQNSSILWTRAGDILREMYAAYERAYNFVFIQLFVKKYKTIDNSYSRVPAEFHPHTPLVIYEPPLPPKNLFFTYDKTYAGEPISVMMQTIDGVDVPARVYANLVGFRQKFQEQFPNSTDVDARMVELGALSTDRKGFLLANSIGGQPHYEWNLAPMTRQLSQGLGITGGHIGWHGMERLILKFLTDFCTSVFWRLRIRYDDNDNSRRPTEFILDADFKLYGQLYNRAHMKCLNNDQTWCYAFQFDHPWVEING
jgi:hypothetical protein